MMGVQVVVDIKTKKIEKKSIQNQVGYRVSSRLKLIRNTFSVSGAWMRKDESANELH